MTEYDETEEATADDPFSGPPVYFRSEVVINEDRTLAVDYEVNHVYKIFAMHFECTPHRFEITFRDPDQALALADGIRKWATIFKTGSPAPEETLEIYPVPKPKPGTPPVMHRTGQEAIPVMPDDGEPEAGGKSTE